MNLETCPLVSIIINNYNYESFLQIAINSALKQTYSNIEVVVVDDGSTDRSREIIESYGDHIIPVLKNNGGQASSLNTGVQVSSGSILCFLDADDIFCSQKVEAIVNLFSEIGWRNKYILLNDFLQVIDQNEVPIKVDLVNEVLSDPGEWRFLSELGGKPVFFDGQLNQVSTPEQVYRFAANYRFVPYLGVQTSGITMTKSLANKVFPLPEEGIRVSADVFLVKAASLYGTVYSTSNTLTKYRVHGSNNWFGRKNQTGFDEIKYFFSELNNFLNLKLVDLGKKPVFSYLDSMSAKGYYRSCFGFQSYKQLLDLSFKVLSWHVNSTTIHFFTKTTLLAIYFKFRCFLSTNKS
ncbi:glycosyltransferase family A protein [Nostoc sp. UHCC 0251]|uniref:glycosyltransferase family 2 protein n=1 Tax=Nostoc sp. UHCC 0251 TaxID=3110240 RepID=UPI002B1EAA22|nr:glycosyltransferase family A protein [Nostoc sp. UHCC 0251]MEA5624983.1 glycosyltransferase family A protein [Nostoc sp. UHCC 0251]